MILHSLFGYKHIILLIVSIILVILGAIFTRKLKFNTIIKSCFYIGIACEVIKVFYYIITNEAKTGGYLPKSDLPFHLCSIQIIFFSILFFSKNEKIKRTLISFMIPSCLFGGLFALLIPTDSARNGMWVITAEYFIYHALIMIFALYILINKEINLNIKDYRNCLILLAVFGLLSIYINSILNDGTGKINFMYTVSPPQDNLPYLNKDQGWAMYILKYASLAVLLITLLYIKPIIDWIKELKNKNKEQASN